MNRVRRITIVGLMVALSLVLDYLSFRLEFTKITLYALPLLLTGILFGPVVGLFAGIVEGFLSQLLTYGLSITTPLWMLASIVWGVMSGVLYKYVFKNNQHLFRVLFTVLITSLLVTGVNTLVTYLDGLIFHYPVQMTLVLILTRVTLSISFAAIYIIILYIIIPRLERFVNQKL